MYPYIIERDCQLARHAKQQAMVQRLIAHFAPYLIAYFKRMKRP